MGREIPTLNMLRGYKSKMRFHTPGHKGRLREIGRAAKYDITELDFSDNILSPSGVFNRLNQRLTNRFGLNARILTGGATIGVFIMLSQFAGKTLLISRQSHTSVYNAAEIFGITLITIEDKVTTDTKNVNTQEVLSKLRGIDAVLLTTPNYFGNVCELDKVAEGLRVAGVPLLVDAAHGSHFAYSMLLPEVASKYADIAVFSLHKTCPALTGAALICSSDMFLQGVERSIKRLCSTSPSYLIALSIDIADKKMCEYDRIIAKQKGVIGSYRDRIEAQGMRIEQSSDFTRLVILAANEGEKLNKYLMSVGIYSEMATSDRVVFIITINDSLAKIRKLLKTICRFNATGGECKKVEFMVKKGVKRHGAESQQIELSLAEGRTSAVNFGLYPPSVPLTLVGEVIQRQAINIITENGKNIFGIENGKVEVYL